MGAGHSADGDAGAYASDPPACERKKSHSRRRRHSVDSVASYSSQNHVDRIRTQNFSAASCQDDSDFGSIKTSLFRRSSSNLEYPVKRPDSVTSNTSSTRSRLRELVERKSSQDEHRSGANPVVDIQYFENPAETLEFDSPRNSLDSRKNQDERPKKRKLSKTKEPNDNKNKKQEKYQSKLADYYKLPVQLPQDEFYQHLTRSRAAEDFLQKRFSNSEAEFSGSYGRLCKHKEIEGSNLRRSRSLAVIREETFTDLQIQNHGKNKRSQLIPRARLFDKPCFKDRLTGRAKYQTKEEVLEGIYIDSTVSCFADISRQGQEESNTGPVTNDNNSEKGGSVCNESQHSKSANGSWANLTEETKQINISEDSIGHSRNPSDIDSLDSNYVRKHYNFEAHLKNYRDGSPDTGRSLASQSCKDLFIATDEQDSDTECRLKSETPNSVTKERVPSAQSQGNDYNELDNFKVDDHVTYDKISIQSKEVDVKDNHTDIYGNCNETKDDGDNQSIISENDGTISSPPDSITSYISISIASSTEKSHKLEYLAHSLAEKIDEYCDSQNRDKDSEKSPEVNSENQPDKEPIYTSVQKKKTFADLRRESFARKQNSYQEKINNENNDSYVSRTYIDTETYDKRGSCTSKNITTEPFVTTLIENQYYSLPDINISKCLRKSERIDAQLRKEDPEDNPCENTYEVAQTHFREILCSKSNENYGQLNKSLTNILPVKNVSHSTAIYLPEFTETQILQNCTKLEDDLKSIVTIESSNPDDHARDFLLDNHQNEREINEIEGTIRNTKLVTKSESLKINSNSACRQNHNIFKSLSNDNIHKSIKGKIKTNIKKHYSLRQRDPVDSVPIASPNTVIRGLKNIDRNRVFSNPSFAEEIRNHCLLSRVKSFKTSENSNIDIVPLSGHQTLVIDPPLNQCTDKPRPPKHSEEEFTTNSKNKHNIQKIPSSNDTTPDITKNCDSLSKEPNTSVPKESFFTIKLNKVVKTNLPKLQTNTCDHIDLNTQAAINKPPSKLIIKDHKNYSLTRKFDNTNNNMTRPQILQVVDSKSKKNNNSQEKNILPEKLENNCIQTEDNREIKVSLKVLQMDYIKTEDSRETKESLKVPKIENFQVKDKLDDAIKTDIEYQEKISSVKNYWSKLIDKSPENFTKQEREGYVAPSQLDKIDENASAAELSNTSFIPEISVGKIIKSLENVKIVDSIKKIGQTKLQLWKDETEKVKSDSEIEEAPIEKIVKETVENQNLYQTTKSDKNKQTGELDFYRDTPEIEIVELSSDDNQNQKTQATLIKAKGYEKGCDDFDHVRYKVMKSELFKNSMIANYRKEAQFDGLLQYLQDYSFQELLTNNNIVIIEPVRTKVEPSPRKTNNTDTCKINPGQLKKSECMSQTEKTKNAIRRHFFYHPIRVNKEIIEEELPNPDTVKKVRNLFEDTLKMKSPMTQDPPLEENICLTRRSTSYRNLSEEVKSNKGVGRKKIIRQLTIDTNFGNKKWDNASLSSGVSSGDLSSNNDYETDALSPYSNKNIKDNAYSSSEEYLCDSANQDFCCESQYVSPDILKKIRECGTSVTYYGGKVLNSKMGSNVSPMTKAIMEEIKSLQRNCSTNCYSCQTKCKGEKCACLIADRHRQIMAEKESPPKVESENIISPEKQLRADNFPGFKFKLVKSNSCSSRLELTGTDENKTLKNKFRRQNSKEDPPLVHDEENSVKNKICRLESYSKGQLKTPVKIKPNDDKKKYQAEQSKDTVIKAKDTLQTLNSCNENDEEMTNKEQETGSQKDLIQDKNENHSFEKKFYYVNDNLEYKKTETKGKFGEMVFEEFEVLENCYDSLNSNKSFK